MSNNTTLTIDSRFCGPPESANGGYTCGLLAMRLGGQAQITLRSPPPLDTPMALDRQADGGLHLLDGGQLIAEAAPCELELDVPPPVPLEMAETAARGYPWATDHPFATCFVCGPERTQGDGLRIFPGPVSSRDVVAAPWVPGPDLGDDNARVCDEFLWAALDCPSWFGAAAFHPELRVGLLAQFAVRIIQRPPVDESCVVIGWTLEIDGRKVRVGSAVFAENGHPAAIARALWIQAR